MLTGTSEEMISQLNETPTKKPFSQRVVGFFSNLTRKNILDAIIVFIPIALIYIYMTSINPSEIRQTLKDNKKIEVKVDSLKTDNEFIVQRMYELERNQTMFFDLINKNNNLIHENNKELQKLKKIYNAKINSVNEYNVSQLDSFFTNRYKDYYNNR